MKGKIVEPDKITQKKIVVDQVQRLSTQTFVGISATALNSVILAIMLLGVTPRPRVLLWLSLFLLVCLVRMVIQIYYQKRPLHPGNVGSRKTIILFSLAVSGCLWGAVPVFLFPDSSPSHQVLIALVLGGMVAGSVGVFASIMATFYAFSIPIMLPLVIVFFTVGDSLHLAMGSMLLIFGFFMFMAAKRLNGEIYQFLFVKYENIGLIASLEKEIQERQTAQKELMRKKQQIESIVEERTAKLHVEIDDRIEAEKALRESEEKYRELANSLPQIVFETDVRGIITFANRNMHELLGYSKDDFDRGLSVFQILATDGDNQADEKLRSRVRSVNMASYEYLACTKDGRTFPIELHSTPVMQANRSVGMRGIIIDLTEKKRAEEEQKDLEAQLQRAQKMEVLGTMAGGVAHDLNNILSGIVSYPDLLLMQIPPDSSFRKPIQTIQESGKKAAAIVQDLLTLTRRGVVVEEVVNLNHVIREYLESPEHEKLMSFHPAIQVETSLETELLDIAGSRVHLVKAAMNLISNAAEAMPSGGMIEIATTNRYLDQPVKGYDDIEEGDYVVMTVSDNGMGIAPRDIDRIFEPFFTKKNMGRSGTGLGMAVVWGAVKDHKGYIDVTSAEGQGAVFSVYFPVTRKQRTVIEKQDSISSYLGQGESILLVDDVKEQRQIASDMLLQLGYQVTVVSSGEDAIDYLRENRADVIVLDMIMDPGMDGLDTFKKILEIHPAQKAIIASGFSETDRIKEAIRLGAGPYIKKPYTWIKFGQAIKAALDNTAPPLGRVE